MEKELSEFICKWNLKPFNKKKTPIKSSGKSIFKTKDAREVYNRASNILSKRFNFTETANLLDFFTFTSNELEILNRQKFFKTIKPSNNSFLKNLKEPKPFWNPDYGIVVATEQDSTFKTLKELGCAVKFIVNEQDVLELERYDIVQVLDCDNFSLALERLPQTVFLNSIDEAYLERHVRLLSGWKNNLEILNSINIDEGLKSLAAELNSFSYLFSKENKYQISREKVEDSLESIKEEISNKVSELNISGNSLLEVLNKGVLPKELNDIVNASIKKTALPESLFIKSIPISIDEKELEKVLREQSLNQFASSAERIKKAAKQASSIPKKLSELETKLLLFDFTSVLCDWMKDKTFPVFTEELYLESSFNEFLDNPSPISFHLNAQHKCSILTGANSGGKTTLLEHIIQLICYSYLGLPINGSFKVPLFSEIYYFAKNKGSMSKGAFETLLTQLSEIETGSKTLILADEIEAVTEPGVAGKMIAASASFFINKGCYIIFATHLGQEINKILPKNARIDGIEAKGLDENNELIVDHNPILGRLASSTPELIVEKMSKSSDNSYFKFLHEYLRNNSHYRSSR